MNEPLDQRIAIIIASAAELRIAVMPREDLWPAIAYRTTLARSQRRFIPWIYLAVAAVVVLIVIVAWNTVPGRSASSRQAVAAAWRANSDGDRREALRDALPTVSRDKRETAWSEFFSAVGTIKSDGERRKVLLDATKYATENPPVAIMILRSAMPMKSLSNKADVMVALARVDAVRANEVRAVYFKVVSTMPRGVDRARAVDALPPD